MHRVVAGFGVVASFVPIPGAAKAGKLVGKALVITAEMLTKKIDGVSVIEKTSPGLLNTYQEKHQRYSKNLNPNTKPLKPSPKQATVEGDAHDQSSDRSRFSSHSSCAWVDR